MYAHTFKCLGMEKDGENRFLYWVSSVAMLRVRPIDKLNEACTNAEDRIILVQYCGGDCAMS